MILPTVLIIRRYNQMDEKGRKDVIQTLKSTHFIFSFGFLVLGSFILMLGSVFSVFALIVAGMVFINIFAVYQVIKAKKATFVRSILILLLIIFLNLYIFG